MKTALWIIAAVEVIRMIQNTIQLYMVRKANSNELYKKATDAFVESLNKTDKEFIKILFNEEMKKDRLNCGEDADCEECSCKIGTDDCVYNYIRGEE